MRWINLICWICHFHTIKSILNQSKIDQVEFEDGYHFHTIKSILNRTSKDSNPDLEENFHTIKSILNF